MPRNFNHQLVSLQTIVSLSVGMLSGTEAKLSSFASLPDGWDYGRGGPVSQRVLDAAFAWNSFLKLHNFLETDAFPGGEGEVIVAAGCGDHYLEIIVEIDGTVSVAYDRKGKQELYLAELSPSAAEIALLEIVGQIWNTSAYYTQINSTVSRTNLLGELLGIRGPMDAYRLSVWNVLKDLTWQSVNTSENTTYNFQESSEIPQFSGDLSPMYFQMDTR